MCCVFCKVLLSIVAVWRVMSYAPWRIWGLSPRREKRFLYFSECPASYSFSTRSSFWRYAVQNVWSWPITISSTKVQICIHSSWLGIFSYRICAIFFLLILCSLTQSLHTVQSLFCLCKSLAVICQLCKKNVIILHFSSSSSLWNWYKKSVNDWCVFGEVWVNILSCVLSSKLYLCHFCRETNVLTITVSCLLTPHSAFRFSFFSGLTWRIYSAENLPNYTASPQKT